jgi:hypothetical protein
MAIFENPKQKEKLVQQIGLLIIYDTLMSDAQIPSDLSSISQLD